ncbi:hypothetical protein Nepgr_023926 [Nepenthes gracilis]|uniref:Uncharacterized protein n=1 Tax=Nepenthes gracilis TaxID=150966 RepID=A0AAD3T1V8_NEPGR|nr:hypothetical protein Nepgr_023926 [Nepenthes gracilis]
MSFPRTTSLQGRQKTHHPSNKEPKLASKAFESGILGPPEYTSSITNTTQPDSHTASAPTIEATFRTQHQTKFSIEKTRESGTCRDLRAKANKTDNQAKGSMGSASGCEGPKVKGGNQARSIAGRI